MTNDKRPADDGGVAAPSAKKKRHAENEDRSDVLGGEGGASSTAGAAAASAAVPPVEAPSSPAASSAASAVPAAPKPSAATLEEVTSKVVTNDGTPETMELLIALKNIFSKQLPKMPREYIVRLVFDRKHKSLALLRNGVPIGGICYRPHHSQGFGEIAFCAVNETHQVKGNGTTMMNMLKEYARNEGLRFFITYADEFAIGYFKKLGFTKTPSIPKEKRDPFIKQYEGALYMECYLHPTIDFTKAREVFLTQRSFLLDRIKGCSQMERVYSGMTSFPEGGDITDALTTVPGVADAGWTVEALEAQKAATEGNLKSMALDMVQLCDRIWEYVSSWPFRSPVDTKEVSDYLDVIKNPIDLSQIKLRAEQLNYYTSHDMLKADLLLMVNNCKRYNKPETDYYKCAVEVEGLIEECFRPDSAEAAAANRKTASAAAQQQQR